MDEQYQLPAPWRYKKVKQTWYHKNHPFTETITTWNLLKTQLCHEIHEKDEWLLNQLEDWNSKPMSCGHWSNYTRFRKETHSKESPWLPWIVNDIFSLLIDIRSDSKQDPRIREASDRIRKSLYRPDSKLRKSMKSFWVMNKSLFGVFID